MPSARKNRTDDPRNIDDTLDEMYQDADGSRPDMKHFDYQKSRAGLVVVFFILFFLASAAAAAWLGFFLFSPSQKFSENQIITDVVKPTEIINGIEQDYKITVRNTGALALANTEVILKLPDGFIVTEATPKASTERQDTWALGAIDGEQNKVIALKAVYGKPKDTKDTLRVFIHFKPSNFNSEFEKVTDSLLTVVRDAIMVQLSKKSSVEGNEFEIKYKNMTDTKISNLVVGLDAGTSFKMSKAIPSAKLLAGIISLQVPELLANTESIFTITGAYTASSTLPTSNVATVTRTFNGKKIEIAKTELQSDAQAIEGDFKSDTFSTSALSLSANNSKVLSAKPGDVIKLAITYKNKTDKPVTNASFILIGEAPSAANKSVLDYANLGTIGDPDVIGRQITPTKREARITWTPQKTAVLKEIAPGQQVVIEVSVGVKKLESVPTGGVASFNVSLSADNDVLQAGDGPVTITIEQ